ncbi:hypothetical protein D3C86_773710 [compost metagenome]
MISWIFFYDFVLQAFVSSILVIYNLDFHYLISKIGNPDARVMGFFSVQYMMVGLPMGMLIANFCFRFNSKRELSNYQLKPMVTLISRNDSYIRFPLYILSLISFLSILYTFYTIRSFPILHMLSGADAVSLGNMRSDAKAGFEGITFIRNVFGLALTPILAFISYGYFKMTNRFNDKIWFIIMVILSVLILTYNLEKAPVAFFLIGFFIFRVLYKGNVSKRVLIYLALTLFVLMVFLYTFLTASFDIRNFFDIRTGILGRIFLGQSAGLYLTFDTFPKPFDFLGFSTMSDSFVSLLGIEHQDRLGRLLIERYNPNAVDLGTAGVINTFFIAEAWANFGWIGWIFSPLYVGFLIQCMYIFFLKNSKTPFLMGLFVYFSYKGGIGGGFNEYIYNPGLIIVTLVVFFMFSYGRSLKNAGI